MEHKRGYFVLYFVGVNVVCVLPKKVIQAWIDMRMMSLFYKVAVLEILKAFRVLDRHGLIFKQLILYTLISNE